VPSRRVPAPTIRQYRRHDDPQVWALAEATAGSQPAAPLPLPLEPADGPPPQSPDLADIARVFLQSGGDFLVAEVGGAVVGTAGLLLGDDGQADVVRVAVHPAVRRRGIGTALLEAVERRAVGLGIHRLNLDVGDNAQDAIAFYLASGFHRHGEDEDTDQRWDVSFFSKALKVLP
jgi:N-acetylglutamate synthase-like GNAT family acetyltransferase